jgi:glutathione S-transferase
MTLYLKAAEDGSSVGDCPFAHAVRLVLEEKQLEYDLEPCVPDSKPDWLVDLYEGKMPALRHRKECYVESSVISEYLDFFFRTPSLKAKGVENEEVLEGFFPAVAQYLKDVDDTEEKLDQLKVKLSSLDEHLKDREFVCGDQFTLLDCRLLPQLYHLQVGSEGFKKGIPSLETDEYPHLSKYYQLASQRPSFQTTVYPPETVLWGWGNARN